VLFVVDKQHWDRLFSDFFVFTLSISFHHGSPYLYIIWGLTIGLLVAAVQRYSLTALAWTAETTASYNDTEELDIGTCLEALTAISQALIYNISRYYRDQG
jgi:D-alanyl-lipoteichoic acid acyltransferase DltB (MBOAT superfamily)